MNRFFISKKLFFAYIVTSYVHISYAYFDFDSMERHFQEMHQSMEQSFDQIREQMYNSFKRDMPFSAWKIDCTDSEDGKSLIVGVMGVETHDVKARLSDDAMHLTIITDNGTVNLKASKNWISIGVKQSKEVKKKSKKKSMHSESISSKSTSRTVTHDVDLAEAKVDYNPKNQILMIEIPYRKETKRERVIPVTINTDIGSDDSDADITDESEEMVK